MVLLFYVWINFLFFFFFAILGAVDFRSVSNFRLAINLIMFEEYIRLVNHEFELAALVFFGINRLQRRIAKLGFDCWLAKLLEK